MSQDSKRIEMMRLLKKGLWYMAHPYRGNEVANFEDANLRAAMLARLGIMVISPISMSHPIDRIGIQHGWWAKDKAEHWMRTDYNTILGCTGLIFCDGWENSTGCKLELKWARDMGKPTFMFKDIMAGETDVDRAAGRKDIQIGKDGLNL